ncbi:unnamed protein product [Aspergillus oryzae]|uniref:Unnamed protein product n=1 Tax=Aspergillus oryzae TaxID=5062 RepID=A0AAN5C2L7_ASPOZ|nr:unnamed protein product [Aspergillus oryzae]GMG35372.1 unnamed protein product [Aspergillus oryzae]
MAKTVVATGTSSGLPYNFILGVRDTVKTQGNYDRIDFDRSKHTITIFPLDLLSLPSVQSFAQKALSQLGDQKLDYLFLCAGMLDSADGPGPNGSPWCSGYVVNHLVVVVSSGAIRNVRGQDPGKFTFPARYSTIQIMNTDSGILATLDVDLKANSKAGVRPVYSASKFVQLLGAFYWRRELPSCTVIAVSPGLIPSTNLATDLGLSMDMPDAKTIPEGKFIRMVMIGRGST